MRAALGVAVWLNGDLVDLVGGCAGSAPEPTVHQVSEEDGENGESHTSCHGCNYACEYEEVVQTVGTFE